MFDYRNKVVLITGASAGLGACLVEAFHQADSKVALVSRDQEKLEVLANKHDPSATQLKVFACDLLQLDSLPNLVTKIQKAFDRPVDVLVHNAGMSCYGEIEGCPIEVVQQILTLNFLAGVRLTQLVIPSMKTQRSGQIVWIGSGSAIRGIPFAAAYSASKAAAKAFCESLRGEVKKFDIDILSIIPGALATDFHANQTVYGQTQKLRRTGSPQSPNKLAAKILHAGARHKKEMVASCNVRVGRHLAYWQPTLLDLLYQWQLGDTCDDH